MPTTSLWPDFPTEAKPRGMRQMLEDAGGDISEKTGGVIHFRVRTIPDGDKFYHDCYLVVPKVGYQHLLLRVTCGVKPFPATITTPDGHSYAGIQDEEHLRFLLKDNFQGPETGDIVMNLLAAFADPSK